MGSELELEPELERASELAPEQASESAMVAETEVGKPAVNTALVSEPVALLVRNTRLPSGRADL